MNKNNYTLSDLISQKEAAKLRGVTRQAIANLVKRGKLNTVDISGHQFLIRKEVEEFKPNITGRPRKTPKE